MWLRLVEIDIYTIVDLPDHARAMVSLIANVSETVSVKTMVLLTPEEMDKAAKKTLDYRLPGQ